MTMTGMKSAPRVPIAAAKLLELHWTARRGGTAHCAAPLLFARAAVSSGNLVAQTSRLVPGVRIELTTYRLQGGCSTSELTRRLGQIWAYRRLALGGEGGQECPL